MKIFQTPSYDRFCLFEMERKSKDFRGMDDNVAYKNKQIDNVEISNEGRRALREKLREVKPKVEEPIGYELTIQDTKIKPMISGTPVKFIVFKKPAPLMAITAPRLDQAK